MGQNSRRATKNESGFSLIEIIISIVLVGIAVPTFSNYFGGLNNSKQPEYLSEGVFFGTGQLERIGNEPFLRIPTTGTYTCTEFRDWSANPVNVAPPNDFILNIECPPPGPPNPPFNYNWTVSTVSALTPNTPASGAFGKRVVLTISRPDGGMSDIQLVTLF